MAIDIVRGAIKNQIASADLIETINGVQNDIRELYFWHIHYRRRQKVL